MDLATLMEACARAFDTPAWTADGGFDLDVLLGEEPGSRGQVVAVRWRQGADGRPWLSIFSAVGPCPEGTELRPLLRALRHARHAALVLAEPGDDGSECLQVVGAADAERAGPEEVIAVVGEVAALADSFEHLLFGVDRR